MLPVVLIFVVSLHVISTYCYPHRNQCSWQCRVKVSSRVRVLFDVVFFLIGHKGEMCGSGSTSLQCNCRFKSAQGLVNTQDSVEIKISTDDAKNIRRNHNTIRTVFLFSKH